MIISLLKICKRCNKSFHYGDFNKSLQGQMTRKYCDKCKVLQHQDESREYQRQKRLNNTIS
jgi:hypothetical protein